MSAELISNTPEWHEFRRKKIGASDAPVIMEVSPWKTPYQLWMEKMGATLPHMTSRQRRGHELEETARQAFEKKTGVSMFPKVMLHPSLNWMMASLDGIDLDGKSVVEIKCPGPADHEIAKKGKAPEKYYPQLQHQLAVTGVEMMYYFSFDGSDGIIIEIRRDDAYIAKMIELEQAFWQYIEACAPPPMNERDFVTREDEDWIKTSQKWLQIHQQLGVLEGEEKMLRESLIQMAGSQNALGGGLRVTRSLRKGAVQYGKIPELQGVDLEKHRKEPTEVWRLTAV